MIRLRRRPSRAQLEAAAAAAHERAERAGSELVALRRQLTLARESEADSRLGAALYAELLDRACAERRRLEERIARGVHLLLTDTEPETEGDQCHQPAD